MRGACALLAALLAVRAAGALEVKLDQSDEDRQRCTGMYNRNAWGGPVDPFILIKFLPTPDVDGDPIVSLVIFEWRDQELIGLLPTPDATQKVGICEHNSVAAGLCNDTDIGEFILAANATEKSNNLILTQAIHLKDSRPINYPIKKTGYYCVLTQSLSADKYTAVAEFRNAYGELPAAQIPKLPFYGGITILYALVVAFWGFLYYQHRSDILPVQNYITAILVFLVVEMLMTWGFYDYLNRNGANVGSKVLLIVVAILNAARNSFSFFLLLIVCMGYGVVKPTLGRTMVYVRWLAVAHFAFGLVYAIASLLLTPDAAGPFVLLIVLPLAGTLTAFYVWTLNSLNWTLRDLRERRQHAKEAMYRKLWWCILVSILVIFGFFFLTSFTFASASDPDYVPFHWKSRWFILDGWLNLVYFADVAWIAYVWRPTANNRRFAMSDELAQDDDGTFEIGDIGIPGADDSEEESNDDEGRGGAGGKGAAGARRAMPAAGLSASAAAAAPSDSRGRADSRPRAKPDQDESAPRRSLDGETIFALGDDGDEDGDDEEHTKLVPSSK